MFSQYKNVVISAIDIEGEKMGTARAGPQK